MRSAVMVLGFVAGVVTATAHAQVSLGMLTVPSASLPESCALQVPVAATAARTFESGLVRVKADSGSQFQANPWSGADRAKVLSIVHTIDPSLMSGDAPPLSRNQQAALDDRWIANIREAYHATYAVSGGAAVYVNAVTFADGLVPASTAVHGAVNTARSAGVSQRIVLRDTLITVASAKVSPCYTAVRAHLQQLK